MMAQQSHIVSSSHLSLREVKISCLTATSPRASGAPLDDRRSWRQWRRWSLLGVLYRFANAFGCRSVSHTRARVRSSSSLDCQQVLGRGISSRGAGVHLRQCDILWLGTHLRYLTSLNTWRGFGFEESPCSWGVDGVLDSGLRLLQNNSWELASFRGSLTFECETQGRVTSCVCLPRSSRPPWSPSLFTICLIFWNKVNGY